MKSRLLRKGFRSAAFYFVIKEKMNDFRRLGERDYLLLRNFKVEFGRDDGDADADEANGCFALCFWLYIDNCASFPSEILVQVLQLISFLNLSLLSSLFVKHGIIMCLKVSISF